MPKKPDMWIRLVSRFAGSKDLEDKEKHTDDVIAHAEKVQKEADRILRHEYALAEQRYRGS